MLGNVLTRRGALLGFGGFVAAGLSGCNTTPSTGVQAAGSGAGRSHGRHDRLDESDRWLGAAKLAGRAGPGCRVGDAASCANWYGLSGRWRGRRSRPDKGRRDVGRQDDKRAGDLDLYSEPDGSGAAGTGAAGPGAGAVGRIRLPAETKNGVTTAGIELSNRAAELSLRPACAGFSATRTSAVARCLLRSRRVWRSTSRRPTGAPTMPLSPPMTNTMLFKPPRGQSIPDNAPSS